MLYVAYHALRAKRDDYAFIADFKAGDKAQNSFAKEFALGFFLVCQIPKASSFI